MARPATSPLLPKIRRAFAREGDPEITRGVEANRARLSPLSVREALKNTARARPTTSSPARATR